MNGQKSTWMKRISGACSIFFDESLEGNHRISSNLFVIYFTSIFFFFCSIITFSCVVVVMEMEEAKSTLLHLKNKKFHHHTLSTFLLILSSEWCLFYSMRMWWCFHTGLRFPKNLPPPQDVECLWIRERRKKFFLCLFSENFSTFSRCLFFSRFSCFLRLLLTSSNHQINVNFMTEWSGKYVESFTIPLECSLSLLGNVFFTFFESVRKMKIDNKCDIFAIKIRMCEK